MKKLLLIPILSFGVSFDSIKKDITNSLAYKISQKKVEIYSQKLNSIKSKNYGSLDLEYDAVHMFEQPYSYVKIPPLIDTKSNLSDKNHFIVELKYSYPLFTGFAISNLIEKSKLELLKEKLNLKNTKRILILQTAQIYSNIYALKEKIRALNFAKEALVSEKEKAIGFYNLGLLDKSKVDEINAKYYEVVADIENTKANKKALLNTLSYILNKKINNIDSIEIYKINKPDFQKRADVKIINQTLKIANKDIEIAKSDNYPKVEFEIALKKEADNMKLDENKYQNIDKSYVGIGIKYNIFSGGETKANMQLAKIAKSSTILFYNDYLNKIKTEYENDIDKYKGLQYQLKAAQKEIISRESYFEYIKAKFNEGLADSSDLNDAISKLALAKAKKEAIKAELFFISIKLQVNGGEV